MSDARSIGQGETTSSALQPMVQTLERWMEETIRLQEQRTNERMEESLRAVEARLMERSNAALRVVEKKIETMESNMKIIENKMKLEGILPEKQKLDGAAREGNTASLESRMKALETSVQKALDSVFPRVTVLLERLEMQDLPDTASSARTSAPSTLTSASTAVPLSSEVPTSSGGYLEKQLMSAVKNGNSHDVAVVLNAGANPNACLPSDTPSETQRPLHLAAKAKKHKVVKLLLQRGADVNGRNSSGETALHVAAMYDPSGRCCEHLIKAGADVESKDLKGRTALYWAIEKNHFVAGNFLTAAGAPYFSL